VSSGLNPTARHGRAAAADALLDRRIRKQVNEFGDLMHDGASVKIERSKGWSLSRWTAKFWGCRMSYAAPPSW